jgi:hypothetical protein
MKTQKEIEQLAKKHFPNSNYSAEIAITSIFRSGFIDGYNYCQEDIIDELTFLFNYLNNSKDEVGIKMVQNLINLLNKKDYDNR